VPVNAREFDGPIDKDLVSEGNNLLMAGGKPAWSSEPAKAAAEVARLTRAGAIA
jgi:hypothetical protein